MTTSTPPTGTVKSHPAHTLLSRAHDPDLATQIFTDKIKNKPLLLTPTTHTSTTDKRALRRHIRHRKQQYHQQHRKPRPLSAKEKRNLKLHDLSTEETRYDIYKGLNRLWQGYILEILGFTVTNTDGSSDGASSVQLASDAEKRIVSANGGQGSLLAAADFHGMEVEVVRCVDVAKVGIKGIVVRETKGTLLVVTERNQSRRVLKRGAVFRVVIELPSNSSAGQTEGEPDRKGDVVGNQQSVRKLVFELHGSQIEIRPVDRATRKFKWHTMDFL